MTETNHAEQFYARHFQRLTEEGLLTEASADAFSLMAQLWQHIETIDTSDSKERVFYVACVKQWQALAKQFGLLPKDRKRSGLDREPDITDILKELNA